MGDSARQDAIEQARVGCFLVALVVLVISLGGFILLGLSLLMAVLARCSSPAGWGSCCSTGRLGGQTDSGLSINRLFSSASVILYLSHVTVPPDILLGTIGSPHRRKWHVE